jgi:hypothetical protein
MLRTLLLMITFVTAAGGAVPLVELTTADDVFHGKVIAKSNDFALLLDRDGALYHVPLRKVIGFEIAEPRFRPYRSIEVRDALRRQFNAGEQVVASPHFVVVGRPAAAKAAAEMLEDVYSGYRWFCSTRRLPISEPEFPLVAIVFPNSESFADYCRRDGVTPHTTLAGYYRETTNRFVCFETASLPSDPIAGVRDTLVHEAIHQLAFNTGLHVRLGANPTWVVEGLAMVLEPENARRPLRSDVRPRDRVNAVRLQQYLATADQPDRLQPAELLSDDSAFKQRPLEAYATAWAMTFYLLETRPGDYARYLRTMASRSPLDEIPAEQRLADFRTEVRTADLAQFEAEMTRFLQRIAAGQPR